MMMHRVVLMVTVCLFLIPPTAQAGPPRGIGVLGDSYSDEYRFYPPDRSTARNWVEILAAARGLNFGRFSTLGRGEPRNGGYEFNWARSDATTEDLIAAGQHSGLAAQVARGEVDVVVIFIGGNDFINALHAPDPATALDEVFPRALANFRAAVEAIRGADPRVRLVLATVPDIRHLPEFAGPIREGRLPLALADAFTAAIQRYNAHVRSFAPGDSRVAMLDLDRMTRLMTALSPDSVPVGGRKLDRVHPGNDLDHFFLADVRHPGTLGQGLMAQMIVDCLNARFDAGIEPLRHRDLVGIATSVAAATPPTAPSPAGPVAASSPERPAPSTATH